MGPKTTINKQETELFISGKTHEPHTLQFCANISGQLWYLLILKPLETKDVTYKIYKGIERRW